MTTIRRRFIVGFGTVAVALAGCGGNKDDGAGGTTSAEKAEISFEVAGSPDEFKLYHELAQDYTKATGVKVNVIDVADEESFGTKLATSIAGGKAPDVALISYRGYKKYAAKDQFEPVTGIDEATYYPEPIKAFTFEGKLQCVPQNLSSQVVYYNKAIFKKAGLEPPARNWTYADALAAAKKIQGSKTADGEEIYGVSIEKELIRLAPFIWSAGGEVFDDDDAPTKIAFDTPAARRGIAHYLALGKVGPSQDEWESTGEDSLFLEGRLGMVFASRKKTPTYRQAKFAWDVAPYPKDVKQVTVLHTDGFCALKGKNSAAALKFVEFAGGPEGQTILTDLGRVVPSIRSLAESAEFQNASPPESNQVFIDAEKHMRALPTIPDSPALESSIGPALEQAYFGNISLDEFIRRAEEETAAVFAGRADNAAIEAEREREAERAKDQAAGKPVEPETEAEREAELEAEREREAEGG